MVPPSTRTSSYRPLRPAGGAGDFTTLAAVIAAGVAGVAAIVRLEASTPEAATSVLLALGVIACLAVILAGPIPCLALIGGLTATGFVPSLGHVGGADVTLADVFLVGLTGWWLWMAIGRAQRVFPDRPRVAFGQLVAILFVGYAGLSLWRLSMVDSGALNDSLVSWLSLLQTAFLAFLATNVITSRRDVNWVLAAVTVGGVIAVVVAAVSGVPLEERSGGTLGPNSLGLVSGVLIVIAVFAIPRGKVGPRLLVVVAGLAGLLLAKSVASFIAAGLALAIGIALASGSGAAQRATRGILGLALAGFVVFSVIQFVRPEVIPGSAGFKSGSAAHRIVVGAAGVEIFERNPLIGVGWRGSDSPRIIGDREVVADVRQRFPDVRPVFFPDVSPTSVHNTYVQILADLGLVGFALFAALIVVIAIRSWALLKRLGRDHPQWPQAFAIVLGLLLVLIWLNDNPLYGGQPETVLPAIFIGALAAIARPAPSPRMAPSWRPRLAPPRGAAAPGAPAPAPRPAAAVASGPALEAATQDVPLIWPGAKRRLTAATGMIVVAGVIGLLAGTWTADDDSTGVAPGAPPSLGLGEYERGLSGELEVLASRRDQRLAELRSARTSDAQARAAGALAHAHQQAAVGLSRVTAPSFVRAEQRSLVEALRRVAESYRRLSRAASSQDAAAYAAARANVQRNERSLDQRIRATRATGPR